jgi:diadenosine tetraphosphate (Ap4A) HIT family hydrolase
MNTNKMPNINKHEIILETDNWIVVLGHKQAYLGYSVIFLKRECQNIVDLTNLELLEFLEVVKKLYEAVKLAFGACHNNLSCLMNEGCQEGKDFWLHWHFRPRYKKQIKFAGLIFEDLEWGHRYSNTRTSIELIAEKDKNVRSKIVKEIKNCLK